MLEVPVLDPRYTKLANLLINYSCAVKPGDFVLIEAIDVPHDFTKELVRVCAAAGGRPLVLLKSNEINRALMLAGSQAPWELPARREKFLMERADCYIGMRGTSNTTELSDVPEIKQKLYESTVW